MAKIEHDDRGREIPDPTKMALPLRLQRAPSLAQEVRNMVRLEVSRAAEEAGLESFEDADDFDVDDEGDLPFSPHELTDMQADAPSGERYRQYLKETLNGESNSRDSGDDGSGDRPLERDAGSENRLGRGSGRSEGGKGAARSGGKGKAKKPVPSGESGHGTGGEPVAPSPDSDE